MFNKTQDHSCQTRGLFYAGYSDVEWTVDLLVLKWKCPLGRRQQCRIGTKTRLEISSRQWSTILNGNQTCWCKFKNILKNKININVKYDTRCSWGRIQQFWMVNNLWNVVLQMTSMQNIEIFSGHQILECWTPHAFLVGYSNFEWTQSQECWTSDVLFAG